MGLREVEERLVLAEGQLVEVADHEGVGDVLNGERLLALGVEGVLFLVDAAVVAGKKRVGVGDGLRPGVGGLEVEAAGEAALDARR